jgi:hypothetical protein
VYSFKPKHCTAYQFYTCIVACQKSMMFQTGRFSMYSKMAGAVFHSIAAFCAPIRNAVIVDRVVFQSDCHKEKCCTADCYSQMSEFDSGISQP